MSLTSLYDVNLSVPKSVWRCSLTQGTILLGSGSPSMQSMLELGGLGAYPPGKFLKINAKM